jgi:hypothetical protein
MEVNKSKVMEPRIRRTSLRRLLLTLIGCVATASSLAAAVTTSEYQLKAVFLFNFAQFVEWPASAFSSAEDPIAVCVLGPDPFGPNLDAVLAGERIEGRALIVRRLASAAEIERCHLLFVNQPVEAELRDTLASLKGQPILTVGESEAFTSAGGMIRFLNEGNKVRLQVNPKAADQAQLRLSSKLLRSSQIVARTN